MWTGPVKCQTCGGAVTCETCGSETYLMDNEGNTPARCLPCAKRQPDFAYLVICQACCQADEAEGARTTGETPPDLN